MLVMNMAMAIAFKFKNFITAASIARRLLEIPDINSAKNATLQQKVCVAVAAMLCAPFFTHHVFGSMRAPALRVNVSPRAVSIHAPYTAGETSSTAQRGRGAQREQDQLR
ncbi:MAG: hypothetical protein EOO65_03755 [Methanosarcinales archaeon]|nr:MAG: hypothetical protein EOO65_03755 [Methanosarcinales archaeon]